MKKVICLAVALLCSLGATEIKKCFEYNPNDFVLEQYMFSGDKSIESKAKLENLKIYYIYKDGKLKTATVDYKANGHRFFNPYLYCDKYKGNTNYTCGIECDGGSFDIDKNYAISVDRLAVYRDEPEVENGGEKDLKGKRKGYLSGKEINCPQDVHQGEEPDEKYYKDNKKGLYVCYDWKYKGKYEGCFRSEKSCKFLHRQHFGKYLNQEESAKALDRCKKSTPNKKYMDNKDGLYVCYDYKNDLGEYSGCFRSKLSCKGINKKHFGKYPNRQESYKAFLRCNSSAPRK